LRHNYGRNFRGTGRRWDQCSVKPGLNKKSFNSGFKNGQRVFLIVGGSEFQTDGAEHWKECLEVCANEWLDQQRDGR